MDEGGWSKIKLENSRKTTYSMITFSALPIYNISLNRELILGFIYEYIQGEDFWVIRLYHLENPKYMHAQAPFGDVLGFYLANTSLLWCTKSSTIYISSIILQLIPDPHPPYLVWTVLALPLHWVLILAMPLNFHTNFRISLSI